MGLGLGLALALALALGLGLALALGLALGLGLALALGLASVLAEVSEAVPVPKWVERSILLARVLSGLPHYWLPSLV